MRTQGHTSREVPGDPLADAQSAQERMRKIEARKQAARERAAKSYERRKKAKKGSATQKNSAEDPGAAQSAQTSAPGAGGLADVLDAQPPPAAAEAPDDAAARAALEQLGTPEKFAAFMARMQKIGEAAASRSPRALKVVKALEWARDNGEPTDNCLMGVNLAWPWLEQGGLDFLAVLGPGFMAAVGGALLFGPAVVVALDEYEAGKLERLRKLRELEKDKGGGVVDLPRPAQGAN